MHHGLQNSYYQKIGRQRARTDSLKDWKKEDTQAHLKGKKYSKVFRAIFKCIRNGFLNQNVRVE